MDELNREKSENEEGTANFIHKTAARSKCKTKALNFCTKVAQMRGKMKFGR